MMCKILIAKFSIASNKMDNVTKDIINRLVECGYNCRLRFHLVSKQYLNSHFWLVTSSCS
jgi:hypothetical protein